MKILLVEPDSVLATQYAQVLTRAGHKVIAVSNAADAIATADSLNPELVILEPMLKHHSGLEFLYEFRSYPEWIRVPVILLSLARTDSLGLTSEQMKLLGAELHYKPEMTPKRLEKLVEAIKN